MLREREAHRLLDELCVKLGFCLPPSDRSKLTQDPPRDARAFVDAVFLAEGLDIDVADRHLYRLVQHLVAAAFEQSSRGGRDETTLG